MVAFILLIIGGLNMGISAFGPNILNAVLGSMPDIVMQVVYILIGLAAIFEVVTHKGHCNHCNASGGGASSAPSAGAGGDMTHG